MERDQSQPGTSPTATDLMRIDALRFANAPLGEIVTVAYAVSGAEVVMVDLMEPDVAPYAVPLEGELRTPAGREPQHFRLTAINHDGASLRHTVIIEARTDLGSSGGEPISLPDAKWLKLPSKSGPREIRDWACIALHETHSGSHSLFAHGGTL